MEVTSSQSGASFSKQLAAALAAEDDSVIISSATIAFLMVTFMSTTLRQAQCDMSFEADRSKTERHGSSEARSGQDDNKFSTAAITRGTSRFAMQA